jgi:hypothetical protein
MAPSAQKGAAPDRREKSGECEFVRRQQCRKPLAGKKCVFLLTHGGEIVEPLQFRIHESRMAHHEAAFGQALQKRRKQRLELGGAPVIVGAGERRIGPNPARGGARPQAGAQDIEQEALGVAPSLPQRHGASALPDPGAGRHLLHGGEYCVADLRQQVDVLVSVDEIRGPAEGRPKRRELACGFGRQRIRIEPPEQSCREGM